MCINFFEGLRKVTGACWFLTADAALDRSTAGAETAHAARCVTATWHSSRSADDGMQVRAGARMQARVRAQVKPVTTRRK